LSNSALRVAYWAGLKQSWLRALAYRFQRLSAWKADSAHGYQMKPAGKCSVQSRRPELSSSKKTAEA